LTKRLDRSFRMTNWPDTDIPIHRTAPEKLYSATATNAVSK